ncbi:GNAT family N-acetyltransferase [Shewanella algae]|uniref:GNAT family N-acetyltransferase n=1 Tax=Shewanella algae TaxID=38313 RepID=UPI0031F57885
MDSLSFKHMESLEEIKSCFIIMKQLRSHLIDAETFGLQILRQRESSYHLLAAYKNEDIVGLAGYRYLENLLYGRFLYVDDLIVSSDARNLGLGEKIISFLREEAQSMSCAHLVLDTGMGNALAQRFYFRNDFLPKGIHFSQEI